MPTIERRVSPDGIVHFRARVRLHGNRTASTTLHRKTVAQKWVQKTDGRTSGNWACDRGNSALSRDSALTGQGQLASAATPMRHTPPACPSTRKRNETRDVAQGGRSRDTRTPVGFSAQALIEAAEGPVPSIRRGTPPVTVDMRRRNVQNRTMARSAWFCGMPHKARASCTLDLSMLDRRLGQARWNKAARGQQSIAALPSRCPAQQFQLLGR